MHLVNKISGRIIFYISILNITLILVVTSVIGSYTLFSDIRSFEKTTLPLIRGSVEKESPTLSEQQLKWLVKGGLFSYAGLLKEGKTVAKSESTDESRQIIRRYSLNEKGTLELVIKIPLSRMLKTSLLKTSPVFLALLTLIIASALLFNSLYRKMISKPLIKVVDYLRDFDLIKQGQRFSLSESNREQDRELKNLASSINEIGINMQCTFLFLKETNEKLLAQIEERKVIEEELKSSEERYKDLVERTNDWIWELDENSLFSYISPRIKDLLGYEPEELYGKSPFFLMSAEEAKRVDKIYSAFVEEHSPFNCMINVNLHRDGHEVIMESSAAPIFDEEDNFKGYRGIDRDVTEKTEALRELKRTEAFLHNIIESMPSALFTIDYKEAITRVNRSAAKLAGCKAEELIGEEITSALPYFMRYKKLIEKIKEEQRAAFYHYESFTELKERYFDVSFYPLTTNGIEGIVIRIDEVTEQEKVEKQLMQSQKMESIGVLAGGLAHDFNNVLAGIVTTISLLKYEMAEEELKKEELEEHINTIERAGVRASAIVKQLLAISRKNRTNFTTVDLNSAVENVLKICRNSFDKVVTIESELLPGQALIRSEQTQIEQVILNLCINSYHAMTIMRQSGSVTGGKLSLKVEQFTADARFCQVHLEAKEVDYYRLKVQDSGVGMDSKTIARIFEPFFTTKEQDKGTGLGLSMVYSLVKEHNGFLTVYSEPERGTTVNLFIPSFEGELSSRAIKRTTEIEAESQKGTILIVDDEKVVRSLAAKILERKGYSTMSAPDGNKGLAIFRESYRDISLVLLDISMPEISGREIFIEMKRIYPEVKVIICSGLEQDSRVQELKTMGIKGFLQKPYNMQQLISKVTAIISEEE